MNLEQKHELMFIIAKYLQTLFPDVAKTFINRCESENLFPKPVFSKNATFEELETSFLSGVPDDQLIRIISHVQNNSKFSSLLASMKQTTQNTNTNSNFIGNNDGGGVFDAKLFDDLLCDSLRNQINPLQTVVPPFHRFAAQYRIISHSDKIYCLAVDITSQVLITGSDDFLVKIWKIPEMIPMKTFDVHIDSITDLQIHPSNLYFCSSSHDSTITVFTFKDNGRVVLKLKMDNMVHNIKFSPCGTFLGAACQDGCVSIWNFNEIIEFDKNSQNNTKLKRSDYNIEPIKIIHSPHKRPAAWLSFSPNSGFVAFSCDPNIIIVASINENYSVQLRGHTESPDFVFFSKITCNRILSLSIHERGVRLWESQNDIWDNATFLTNSRKIRLWQATFNCDESRIIGVSTKMIVVWDTYSKQQLFMMSHNEYTDHATIVSSHPTLPAVVFIATSKGRTSLWDVINGQFICGLQSEERIEILEAIWSPDGQFIFTSDSLGGVTIYASDPKNKTKKISDLVPYTEMFFLNEIIETQENEARENGSTVKENTFKDRSLFNQAYYRKVNNKNYELNTLITDRIGNPLSPQPQRFYLKDLRLQVAPKMSHLRASPFNDDEESIALNLMKALFTTSKPKRSSSSASNGSINSAISNANNNDIGEVTNEDVTVVPNFDEVSDSNSKDDDDSKHQAKGGFNDYDNEYETGFDGEGLQRRRKKSREEAEREREERLQRRHRRMAESENESGLSDDSTIASRRKRRTRNQKSERKSLSRTPSTTNTRRKQNSRIKIRNFSSSASASSAGSSEDQEYEIDSANENEDENEEYEDEIEFEREIENEEEEDEEEKREVRNQKQKQKSKSKPKPKKQTKSSSSKRSPRRSSRTRRRPATNAPSASTFTSSDDDTLQSGISSATASSYSSSSSDAEQPLVVPAKTILPPWTFLRKRRIHTYVPQVGDEVVYMRKGHMDWKRECNLMRFTPPYQIRSDLPQVAEARISEVRFYVTHLIITLQFYDYTNGGCAGKSSKRKTRSSGDNYDEIVNKFALTGKGDRKVLFEAKIAYPMPDSPHFIVKASRFVYSMLYTLSLRPNDVVKVEFAAPENSKSSKCGRGKNDDEDDNVKLFKGKIESISQDWINDPWQCINVIFTDDKKPGKLQPWELIFDENKIKKTLQSKIQAVISKRKANNDDIEDEENIIDNDAEMERLNDYLLRFVSEMLQKKENSRLVMMRSNDDQKTLRRKSKFPMDLTLLNDRLSNHWYTSIDSLKHDISLIKSNAPFLIDLNPNLANKVVDQLMKEIEPFAVSKDKNKNKNTKSKSEPEEEEANDDSMPDTDSDADTIPDSDSDSIPASNNKSKKADNDNSSNHRKTIEKTPSKQINKKESSNAQQKSNNRSIIKRESDSSSSDSDSASSSTTSASSSITASYSESE